MRIIKIVWFDETESRMPELCRKKGEDYYQGGMINPDELYIECSFRKPRNNAKKIKITVEEI